jgi:UDP-N-acetylglucosamine--dolichyl-phosphate N-acetylglucosaminephosphotransferase
VLEILETLRLVRLERIPATADPKTGRKPRRDQIVSTTNLTILNSLLVHFGPLREDTLCGVMIAVQILGSVVAFGIRYGVGSWVYGGERR